MSRTLPQLVEETRRYLSGFVGFSEDWFHSAARKFRREEYIKLGATYHEASMAAIRWTMEHPPK